MICGSCKIDRLVADFINNQKFCYHCEYRIKLQKSTERRTLKPMLCRTCGKEIGHDESQKKRQRTVFCSSECAEKGHQEQLKNHWTRKIEVNMQYTDASGHYECNIKRKIWRKYEYE